jgi:glycosyltransferase involved in cell wall biosynthesis
MVDPSPGAKDGTLSVVLPNHNHARFIPRAVAALLNQTPPPDEIIVVDDGSTDDSRAVIARLAADSPRLHVVLNGKNEGAVRAINRGLAEARGSYIYLAAADDFVSPGFFSLALATLRAHPGAGLFCGEAALTDGVTGRPLGIRPPVRPIPRAGYVDPLHAQRLMLRSDNWILTGSSIFRREAIDQAGRLDESLGSFADGFLSRKIALTRGFCYAPATVATWWVLPDSFSRRNTLDPASAQAMLDTMTTRLAKDADFPAWYAPLFGRRWRFATARLALLSEPINRPVLLTMGASAGWDRNVLQGLLRLPPRLARYAAMAWLLLRLRPTTLTGLAGTFLARLRERR